MTLVAVLLRRWQHTLDLRGLFASRSVRAGLHVEHLLMVLGVYVVCMLGRAQHLHVDFIRHQSSIYSSQGMHGPHSGLCGFDPMEEYVKDWHR
jgi:hypothetical protein